MSIKSGTSTGGGPLDTTISTVLPESTTVAAFGDMDTTRPWATESENSFTAET